MDILYLLIENGANLNIQDQSGCSSQKLLTYLRKRFAYFLRFFYNEAKTKLKKI
jgi:hypothetical protein